MFVFLLFCFFDITKLESICYFDKTWYGGLGVMFDDIFVVGYAFLCMAMVKSVL